MCYNVCYITSKSRFCNTEIFDIGHCVRQNCICLNKFWIIIWLCTPKPFTWPAQAGACVTPCDAAGKMDSNKAWLLFKVLLLLCKSDKNQNLPFYIFFAKQQQCRVTAEQCRHGCNALTPNWGDELVLTALASRWSLLKTFNSIYNILAIDIKLDKKA